MPAGDRTGPMGMGPMTGRAAGYCTGNLAPGFANSWAGRGRGGGGGGNRGGAGNRGRGGGGGGFGWRNQYYATGLTGWQRAAMGGPGFAPGMGVAPGAAPFAPAMTGEQELNQLQAQAEYFESALQEIKNRIAEIGGETEQP